MRIVMSAITGALLLTVVLGNGGAWAEGKVTITREESKPQTVTVKAGEAVWFVNASGGTAHVSFAGNDAIQFLVGRGDSKVKFDRPGTYGYTVHISGTKAHAHTGTVVVQ
jgi:plastocyanin